jgi:phosphatidylserine decarboxylase
VVLFDTAQGPMAIIMVGALIVGSMQTVWMNQPIRGRSIITDTSTHTTFKKGDELGYFKLGSTIVALFAKDAIHWLDSIKSGDSVQVGQIIARDNFLLSKAL